MASAQRCALGRNLWAWVFVFAYILGTRGADVSHHNPQESEPEASNLLQLRQGVGPDFLGAAGDKSEADEVAKSLLTRAANKARQEAPVESQNGPVAGHGMQPLLLAKTGKGDSEYVSVRFDHAVESAQQVMGRLAAKARAALGNFSSSFLASSSAAAANATELGSAAAGRAKTHGSGVGEHPAAPVGALSFFHGIQRVNDSASMRKTEKKLSASMVAVEAASHATSSAETSADAEEAQHVDALPKHAPMTLKEQQKALDLAESLSRQHQLENARDQDLQSQGSMEEVMSATREESRWR